jgi:uncharacterized protein YfaS (alpha-2-macroglobulin family)
LVRPGTSLKIPVKLGGLNPGEDAKIVVAAVDVGILNLTNYKPPAPDDYYLGQRRLTSEIRDLYGQLIDGMQGTRGQIRTGGDSAGAELQGSPPTQKPLALYSGIVTVGADGSAEISFDIPEFAGTARVMAVAWNSTKLGRASIDVTVRDPVVLTATLPRFLLNGDKGTMSFDLDNVEGAPGDYSISVKTSGPVKVTGNPTTSVKLAAKQRTSMALALDAGGAGTANLDVDIKGPNGLTLARHYALDVKAATQVLARRSIRTLAKGESLTLTPDMFSDLVSGTGSVSLSVSLSTALDAATILKALDRYPHGCSEQITSRAMPLLYVNDLAAGAHLAMDTAVDQRIKDAIERLLARQGSNGSFGLWSAGGDDAWLDAYVTDFLTRAREKGFAVPDVLFKSSLDRIRNSVVNANEPEKDGGRDLAYGLYVLARNGAAPIGDLRYLADTKLNNLATPIAKSQLAAALALVGDKTRAERVYGAALDALAPKPVIEFGRVDYGSALRDAAALVSLASEGNAPRATLTQAVARVEVARGLSPYTSTQENAWLVLAARALSKETLALDIDGSPVKAAVYRSYKADAMAGKPVKVTNTGDAPVQAVVSVSGSPVTPEPAASNGFKIERNYFTLDGKPADVSKAKQNDRFAVVLKITEAKPGSRSITRTWCRRVTRARWTGSRTARSRSIPSSATTASRPRLIAPATTSRCSRWPTSCARYRPANTCCRRPMSRTCTIPRATAAPAPARWRCVRRNERDSCHSAGCASRRALAVDQEGGGDFGRRRLDRGRQLRRLGCLARTVAAGRGAKGFHHDRRPQRQAAARLCDGGRPLAAAGRCEDISRSRISQAAAGV